MGYELKYVGIQMPGLINMELLNKMISKYECIESRDNIENGDDEIEDLQQGADDRIGPQPESQIVLVIQIIQHLKN